MKPHYILTLNGPVLKPLPASTPDDTLSPQSYLDALAGLNKKYEPLLAPARKALRKRQKLLDQEVQECWQACAPGGRWECDRNKRRSAMFEVARHYDVLLERTPQQRPVFYSHPTATPGFFDEAPKGLIARTSRKLPGSAPQRDRFGQRLDAKPFVAARTQKGAAA